MTDHADLSRRLALAIGWPERNVFVTCGTCFIWRGRDGRGFDYRDPRVIWPIAERYRCFPYSVSGGAWGVSTRDGGYFGDTAAEAVARAVIGGAR